MLKVPFILTIRNGSFSRWCLRWLPRAKILYIQGNIQHTQVFWRQTVGFNSSFNILKVPFILTIRKGSFSKWRPRWLLRGNISISKAIFNIHKSVWCKTVGFSSSFNILKVPFLLTIKKGPFSRWRPRWLPRAIIL